MTDYFIYVWKLAQFSKKYKILPQGPSHLLPCSSLPRGPQPRSWRCISFTAEGPFICVYRLTSFLNLTPGLLGCTELLVSPPHTCYPAVFSETVNVLTGWCSLSMPWTPLSPWPHPSGPSSAPAQTVSWNSHFLVSALLITASYVLPVSQQPPDSSPRRPSLTALLLRALSGFPARLAAGPPPCSAAGRPPAPLSAPLSVPSLLTGFQLHWPAAVPPAPDQAPPSGALSLLSPRPGLFPENPH